MSRHWAMALIVPNLLTIARFGLAAAFPLVDPGWWPAIVILAAFSDAFDGAFSRLFHSTTEFGQILDPIADKVFVAAVLLTLLAGGMLTVPMVLFVAARDLAVGFGVVVALIRLGWSSVRRMPPHWLGKATTGLQFTFLLWVVYDRSVPTALLTMTGAVSVAAGIDYLRNPHWKRPEDAARGVASDDATADLQHPQGDRRA